MSEIQFTHLHVHTQYSLLDGAASVERLIKKAVNSNMNSLAITDHGNMYGIVQFVEIANKNGIKPIIGCEFYVANDRFDRTNRARYHQILLAKNEIGYKNLCKLSSLSFIEGYYYKPRIDKELLKQYHDGIIATSACMASQINQTFLSGDEKIAEQYFQEMHDLFGDDYYLEIQRFNNLEQEKCNQFLLKLAKKYNVKIIATNDVHYVNQEESVAHDILLCIQTGSDYNDPNRMHFCSDTFYLKSPQEMMESFNDIPESLYNTQEIVEKCWEPHLERDVLLPQYEVPDQFNSQSEYLEYLTWNGAKKRFNTITREEGERIRYELEMIHKMGFDGYFLIVQDYIDAAKKMDVVIGPGRGSIAGSLVAYCIGITEVNPLTYGLFFERFLNPERVSMPDIDVDFEDNGREKVIEYVVKKYTKEQVAHLVTFSTMAAKVAIKDVARVLGMSFEKSNKLTKLVPFKITGSLADMCQDVPELKALYDNKDSLEHKILKIASVLEGCKRQTGIHACGIIIAPTKLTDCIPVKADKDCDLLITQYEGSLIEHVGMLKMDFLGLKTLTIIKNTLRLIREHHSIDIDINNIPLDDKETLNLFCDGNTIGVFQFESNGMRQWLSKLKPDRFEDIIAMNALYRPGPIQFIDDFIKRKHGKQKIEYPHPLLEDILKNTYGIMVYQEQVMQVAQIIAGYSLGQADILRKAMGKKKPEEMAKQKKVFIEGCLKKNNIKESESTAIFDMMEKFAQYGFNKAHATAYSVIAFQTAYLKTHYPVEFMTASMINAKTDTGALTPLIQDCHKMKIKLRGPSVNDSNYDFDVNDNGEICYGLAGIKGVGDAAANCIIETRHKHGAFRDIFDFVETVNLRTINKKTLESLALSGAFDCLNSGNRRQYVYIEDDCSFIEKLVEYGSRLNDNKEELKNTLFDGLFDYGMSLKRPEISHCIEYPQLDLLNFEKEYVGFYISSHPLEQYRKCMEKYITMTSNDIQNEEIKKDIEECDGNNKKNILGGIVTKNTIRLSKNNTQYMVVTLEDFYGDITFSIFGNTFNTCKDMLKIGECVFVIGYIEPKYNDPDKNEFRCNNVILMKDAMKRMKLSNEN